MKVGVMSASGQLGAAILEATVMLTSKEDVVALARTPKNVKNTEVEVRPGNYDNPDQLENSLKGIDSLLIVSGNSAPELRIAQHRNVINAAVKAGVKKIVYTSIQGAEEGNVFSPIVKSNRQTEMDVKKSGLEWVIGRNGLYIEPDIEYIENYKKLGKVVNCAGDAKCGYVSRRELGFAYAKMLIEEKHNGETYNLHGKSITQTELVQFLNKAFEISLKYEAVSVNDYKNDRVSELGDFIGNIIAGIYAGIKEGALDNRSDYFKATGRDHQDWNEYFKQFS